MHEYHDAPCADEGSGDHKVRHYLSDCGAFRDRGYRRSYGDGDLYRSSGRRRESGTVNALVSSLARQADVAENAGRYIRRYGRSATLQHYDQLQYRTMVLASRIPPDVLVRIAGQLPGPMAGALDDAMRAVEMQQRRSYWG